MNSYLSYILRSSGLAATAGRALPCAMLFALCCFSETALADDIEWIHTGGSVDAARYSQDGETLYTLKGTVLTAQSTGPLQYRRSIITRGGSFDSGRHALAVSSDGLYLAVAGSSAVDVYRTSDLQLDRTMRLGRDKPTSVDFSSDGSHLVASVDQYMSSQYVAVLEFATMTEVFRSGPGKDLNIVKFANQDRAIFAAGHKVRSFKRGNDWSDWVELSDRGEYYSRANRFLEMSLAVSSDDSRVAVAGRGGHVYVMDAVSRATLTSTQVPGIEYFEGLAYMHDDGKLVLSGLSTNFGNQLSVRQLVVLDSSTLELRSHGPARQSGGIHPHPSGDRVLLYSTWMPLEEFYVETLVPLRRLNTFGGNISSFDVDGGSGSTVIATRNDGIHFTREESVIWSRADLQDEVAYADLAQVVAAAKPWDVHVLDAETGSTIWATPTSIRRPTGIGITRDGRWLALRGDIEGGERVFVWDVPNRTLVAEFTPFGSSTPAIEFSPDGRFLLEVGADGFRLTRTKDWQVHAVVPVSGGSPRHAFSEDGSKLAIHDVDGNVNVFDVQSAMRLSGFEMPRADRMTYTADGKHFWATEYVDNETTRVLTLRDATTGKLIAEVPAGGELFNIQGVIAGSDLSYVLLIRLDAVFRLNTGLD